MGEFNSDDHYIYYCGQESLKRNGVAIIVNKSIQNAVLGCNLKNDIIISARFQGKAFNITVGQVYDIEWFALEANRDLSVAFEIVLKNCVLDSFVDYDGYSISFKGCLPTVGDKMVSELNSSIPVHFSSLIPKMPMFTLAISCLTTSNLP